MNDRTALTLLATAVAAFVLGACERETRRFEGSPGGAQTINAVQLTTLHAGDAPPRMKVDVPDLGNAYAMSQGQQLFKAFNCNGCHANGGGGSGPALMDDVWIYGQEPENIFATIIEGRPNGMPSFRGRLTNDQVWQLVAYVRSLSGNAPADAAPGRGDSIESGMPPSRVEQKPAGMGGTTPEAAPPSK